MSTAGTSTMRVGSFDREGFRLKTRFGERGEEILPDAFDLGRCHHVGFPGDEVDVLKCTVN